MEETKTNVEGQGESVESSDERQTVSIDELNSVLEQVEKLKASNQRILEESKSYANKYRSLRDEVSTKEKEQLEAQENFKDLWQREKDEKFAVEQRFNDLKKTTLRKSLMFDLANLAKDAHDINDVYNALPTDMIEVDYENMEIKGLKEAENWVRENKKHLYAASVTPSVGSNRPDGKPMGDLGPKHPSQLTKAEKAALMRNVLEKSNLF